MVERIQIKATQSEKQAITDYAREHDTDVTNFLLDLAAREIGFERVTRPQGAPKGNTNASANPGATTNEG